ALCYNLCFAFSVRMEKVNWFFNDICGNLIEPALLWTRTFALTRKRFSYLFGNFVVVKEQILIKNEKIESSSLISCGHTSKYEATVITRIKRQGSVLLGKANMDEFGVGSTGYNSSHAPTLNAWTVKNIFISQERTLAGGSSSGSACSVALYCCDSSIGTDTGGSIRQPAFSNGLIGIKPTYGRCSRWGVISYCPLFDQIGIISKTWINCAKASSKIFGRDLKDWNTAKLPVPKYSLYRSKHSRKFLIIKRCVPINNEQWNFCLAALNHNNIYIYETSFKFWSIILPCYCVVSAIELYSNLLRYDGLRYGLRLKGKNSFELFKKLRSVGFGINIKRKIMTGAYILTSKSGYKNFYKKAERVRFLIRNWFIIKFKNYNGLILPTFPTIQLTNKSNSKFDYDIYTIIANLTGLPSIQIPMGMSSDLLPFGFQVIARAFDEICLFEICKQLQETCGSIILW
ncbi:MAG: amidase family protein, partial [Candidatus Hodgkinia cicadicola]